MRQTSLAWCRRLREPQLSQMQQGLVQALIQKNSNENTFESCDEGQTVIQFAFLKG